MKTLLLMRHAKSSHSDETLADHDRPLNGRGRKDAPRMGERLVAADLVPDRILCSTAVRAQLTAERVITAAGFPGPMLDDRRLYHASSETMLAVAAESGGDSARLMLVGHNPGMEELVEELTGFDGPLPTGAIAIITLRITSWQGLHEGLRGTLLEVWTPKDDA